MTAAKRIWIANVPAGVWSTGPVVVHNEQMAQEMIDAGWWVVDGPYVLASEPDDSLPTTYIQEPR